MDMDTKALVSVEEYLHTDYSPDVDYVDGELVERNVGERDHSIIQGLIYGWFLARRAQWNIYPMIELRTQVLPTRFRVPDVCVFLGGPPSVQIPTEPPFIVIEVLSPEDRASVMQKRIKDYLDFGVSYIWVIDPRERTAFVHTRERGFESKDLILRTESPEIVLPLPEIFAALEN